MSNVVEIAQKYRQKLRGELAKVDEFLAYADRLTKSDPPELTLGARDDATQSTARETPAEKSSPSPAGHGAGTNGRPGSDAPSNGRTPLFREPSRQGGRDREKAAG